MARSNRNGRVVAVGDEWRDGRGERPLRALVAAASLSLVASAFAPSMSHAGAPVTGAAGPVLAAAARETVPASPLGNDREAPPPSLPAAPPPPPEVPAGAPPVTPDAAGATTAPDVVVTAPEPRYVAPTRRDRIGRVWAPVFINEQGPFRLVLDTGASASAITPPVALALGLQPDPKRIVKMFGVTGTANVAAVRAESLRVGDVEMESVLLPIVADAFGGAEGVLGNHGLRDKRITIDFRRDRITIIRSKNQRAIDGMITIPVKVTEKGLLVIPARVGDLQVKAIVDTGGQMTIGNMALRDELERRARAKNPRPDQVVGATLDVTDATRLTTPPISLGGATIRNAAITFGEMYIFEHWKLRDEPALLVGMDVLGLLDVLVIDYRRRELQILLRGGSTRAGSYTG
jgi:predicted aspartyl protease